MLNLGLCNQKLSKYRLALYWFRKAQARAHETNLPEYEQAAGQRTRDLANWSRASRSSSRRRRRPTRT